MRRRLLLCSLVALYGATCGALNWRASEWHSLSLADGPEVSELRGKARLLSVGGPPGPEVLAAMEAVDAQAKAARKHANTMAVRWFAAALAVTVGVPCVGMVLAAAGKQDDQGRPADQHGGVAQ